MTSDGGDEGEEGDEGDEGDGDEEGNGEEGAVGDSLVFLIKIALAPKRPILLSACRCRVGKYLGRSLQSCLHRKKWRESRRCRW